MSMKNCQHTWLLRTTGARTYAVCMRCSARFAIDYKADGTAYHGPVPDIYKPDQPVLKQTPTT